MSNDENYNKKSPDDYGAPNESGGMQPRNADRPAAGGGAVREGDNPFTNCNPPDDSSISELQVKLKSFYSGKLKPLEDSCKYHALVEPPLPEPSFVAKPCILVIGEYTAGKTSFIKYLLGNRTFDGMKIAAERSTGCFYAIDENTGGETVVATGTQFFNDPKHQKTFRELTDEKFKTQMKFVRIDAPILKKCIIWDTPGLLKGPTVPKFGYDVNKAIGTLARLADKIFLVWDSQKWRLPDSLCDLVEEHISSFYYKTTLVINKAELLKVSASGGCVENTRRTISNQILWGLSKIFPGPEPLEVLCFSIMDLPGDCDKVEIQRSMDKIFYELCSMIRSKTRLCLEVLQLRLNKLVGLTYVIKEMNSFMGVFSGSSKKKEELIRNLDRIFQEASSKMKQDISMHLDVNELRKRLKTFEMKDLPHLNMSQMAIKTGSAKDDLKRMYPADLREMAFD